MKKCAKCGKENVDKAIFCANCGARLDSISKDFSSSSSSLTLTPALDSLKNYIDKDSSSSSSAGSSVSYPNNNQGTDKGPDKLKICCCYVPVVLFIVFMVAALVYYGAAESFETGYPDDFEILDLNGDGELLLDEILQTNWTIDDSTLTKFFNEADTNHNGYLKGHEFDLFGDDVVRYSEKSDSSNDKYKYSSSSSSSSNSKKGRDYSSGNYNYGNSLNNQEFDSSEGYVLTCPYCGSEAIYETGGYYKCAECGRSIYSPDDLELGYQEGYMELLAPVSLIIN